MAIQVLSAARPTVSSQPAAQKQTAPSQNPRNQLGQAALGRLADTFEQAPAPRSQGLTQAQASAGVDRQANSSGPQGKSGLSAVMDRVQGFLGQVGDAVDHFFSAKGDGSTAPGQGGDSNTAPTTSGDSSTSTQSSSTSGKSSSSAGSAPSSSGSGE